MISNTNLKAFNVNNLRIVIVMPVFKGLIPTEMAIDSALSQNSKSKSIKLLIINDHSPEPLMSDLLSSKKFQYPDTIEIISNQQNLGFVKSVNLGLAYDLSADVVLLNNDVVLPRNWLYQLTMDAYSHPKIGTVTPFSNNTTISSFPNFNQENDTPFDLDIDTINRIFSMNPVAPIESPTGIGFCMFIKRQCILDVGQFDQDTFGMGYGEENDFCQRALKKNWSNVISPNLYVRHIGSVSFGDSRATRVNEGTKKMLEKHPSYMTDVQRFNASDPLRKIRIQRLFELITDSGLPVIVHLSHGLGGGIRQHIDDLVKFHYGSACSLIIEPVGKTASLKIEIERCNNLMSLEVGGPNSTEMIIRLLNSLNLSLIHFHHLRNLPTSLIQSLLSINRKVLFTVHDFQLVPKTQTNFETELDETSIGCSADEFLKKCSNVIFPSRACFEKFSETFFTSNAIITPHLELVPLQTASLFFPFKSTYTVGILGAVNREKGADFLEKIALYSAANSFRYQFIIIGYSYRKLSHIRSTGPYVQTQADELISKYGCDLIFFPTQLEETYSYTLSAALRSRLPIFAPAIGAFPERLAGRKMTGLFDRTHKPEQIALHLQQFIRDLENGLEPPAPEIKTPQYCTEFYKNNYLTTSFENLNTPKQNFNQLTEQLLNIEVQRVFNFREHLLRIIWKLYAYSPLSSIMRLVPMSIKRRIKRFLSTKPIHEVVSETVNSRGRD